MNPTADLANLTLLAPELESKLASELRLAGAQLLLHPALVVSALDDYFALDQAIDNLFGYDWVIFPTPDSAEFFLHHLSETSHQVNELDNLRVCCGCHKTALLLADAHIHVDAIPESPAAREITQTLSDYLGGAANLTLLNCLIPCASNSASPLPHLLDELEARADPVPTFRTSLGNERAKLEALFKGGGIDCAVFTDSFALEEFSRLFDTYDLAHVLQGVVVACPTEFTAEVNSHGLQAHISGDDLLAGILSHFKK